MPTCREAQCHPDAECFENKFGTPECKCRPGFRGDGLQCTPENTGATPLKGMKNFQLKCKWLKARLAILRTIALRLRRASSTTVPVRTVASACQGTRATATAATRPPATDTSIRRRRALIANRTTRAGVPTASSTAEKCTGVWSTELAKIIITILRAQTTQNLKNVMATLQYLSYSRKKYFWLKRKFSGFFYCGLLVNTGKKWFYRIGRIFFYIICLIFLIWFTLWNYLNGHWLDAFVFLFGK